MKVASYFKVSPVLDGLGSYINGAQSLSPLFKNYYLVLVISVKVPKMNEHGSGTYLQCSYRWLNATTLLWSYSEKHSCAAHFVRPGVQQGSASLRFKMYDDTKFKN